MYCIHCRTQVDITARYCPQCGKSVNSEIAPKDTLGQPDFKMLFTKPTPVNSPSLSNDNPIHYEPTPVGLITTTWVLCGCTIIIPPIAIPCSIGMLITSIMLVNSKNTVGKTNGIVALILWVITFIIGFIAGFMAAVG